MQSVTELLNAVDRADAIYYGPNPNRNKISDSQYDGWKKELADHLKLIQNNLALHPNSLLAPRQRDEIKAIQERINRKRSPLAITGKIETFKHTFDVLSLDKVHSADEFRKWAKTLTGNGKDFCGGLKLDGGTIVQYYTHGKLVRVVTAGGDDGVGEVITEKAMMFKGVPTMLPTPLTVVIRSEAMMITADFKTLLEEFDEDDEDRPKTPRNAAMGIIGRLDGTDSDLITCFALDAIGVDGLDTQEIKYSLLKELGFEPAPWKLFKTYEDVVTEFEDLATKRETLNVGIDGYVVIVNSVARQKELGCTEHHPKWAVAWKFPAEEATSRIKDVTLTVGHTGKVTPVAVLEPCQLQCTTVESASLHNWDEIERLDVGVGDGVVITRNGDVIPGVDRVTTRAKGRKPIPRPAACPSCGGPVGHLKNTGGGKSVNLYCLSLNTCPAVQRGKIACWIRKTGIKGIGPAVLDALTAPATVKGERPWVCDIADLYRFQPPNGADRLATMMISGKKFGLKHAQTMLNEIEKSKTLTIDRFVGSLGVKHLGRRRVELIRKAYELSPYAPTQPGVLDKLENWFTPAGKQDSNLLHMAPHLGIKNIAKEIQSGLDAIKPLVEELLSLGIQVSAPVAKSSLGPAQSLDGPLKGVVICLTGAMSRGRKEIAADIIAAGGQVEDDVRKTVTHLCQADPSSKSSKSQKAAKLDIPVISEQQLMEMIG